MSTDKIYQTKHAMLSGFRFDDAVSTVFTDMILRSVPGYAHITAMTGLLAARFIQPKTRAYDLGCSLGASLISVVEHVPHTDYQLIGVDNSSSMLERCRAVLCDLGLDDRAELRCEDLLNTPIKNASFVMLNYTLQFIPPPQRDSLIARIYRGMNSGGALLLSEKVTHPDPDAHTLIDTLHLDFKRANNYSELEISQKRAAIENVLIPQSIESHYERLKKAGFKTVITCFQSLNFSTFMAVK